MVRRPLSNIYYSCIVFFLLNDSHVMLTFYNFLIRSLSEDANRGESDLTANPSGNSSATSTSQPDGSRSLSLRGSRSLLPLTTITSDSDSLHRLDQEHGEIKILEDPIGFVIISVT